MRTTLKRGIGRGATLNGNGHAVVPPGTLTRVIRYRQPEPPRRTGLQLFRRIMLVALLTVLSAALGVAGGAYLYFHQTVAAVRAHSTDVKIAQKELDVKLPGQAAIALVVGYDHRAGVESGLSSRSDTIMLLRADPSTKSISMLSFPRDLYVGIHCPGQPIFHARINGAYAQCGSKGTLQTVKDLTGLPVSYLVTVNFHGFKQIVDRLGGVWLDVDRRYFNNNAGAIRGVSNYATIDLQPGYQRLSGSRALDFVRFRHTDSDFYRLARQQQFVRAFKEQISQQFHPTSLPGILSAITQNVEVGVGGSSALSGKTVLSYALFAYALPPGHFFQAKFQNLGQDSSFDVLASQSDVQNAIDDFQHPDIEASKVATAVALGNKVKTKAPPPETVRVTVLNGNGVPGSAGNAAFQLAQHGYKIVTPSVSANAPAQDYFHSKVYFDPARKGAKAAAKVLQTLFQPADLEPMPPEIGPISPGAAVDVVVGTTFHGTIGGAPAKSIPKRSPPNVVLDRAPTQRLLAPLARRVPFKLEAPTMIERSSVLDAEKPVRLYAIKKGEKAVRLVYRTGATEYWGIEETSWDGAPVLSDRNFHRAIGGRVFDLYFNGPHLHMAVLRANGATYWVVNTLLDSLSNETMLAIAKGLKPLTPGR
jgi:LCP family protein required for cell wall assembly